MSGIRVYCFHIITFDLITSDRYPMPTTRLIYPRGRRGSTRLSRTLRAVWRDTSALWREFGPSILLFAVMVIGGGWLYGELHVLAGNPRIPFNDLPYYVLRMMVLEPPTEDVPAEPYLILFWYLMPLVGLLIVGRGAADFVRLFFNRGERRSAWEEAVASTYRNHVIVLGVGHVGLRVIRALTHMGVEVIGIEQKTKLEVGDELGKLDVPLIIGDGRSEEVLDKAGVKYAQSLIACTASDQTNLEVIMRARDMNAALRIVARVWDDRFARQIKTFFNVQAVHSASDLAAPVFAGAAVGVEITQTLQVHGVDYSMIRLTVTPGSFLSSGTVGELQKQYDLDIVLQGRDGNVEVQPENTNRVLAGDTLVIFARHDRILEITERNRPKPG
jgi:voltage-gated potassium channel